MSDYTMDNVHIMSFILFTQQFQPGGESNPKKPTDIVPVQCLMVVIDPENIPSLNSSICLAPSLPVSSQWPEASQQTVSQMMPELPLIRLTGGLSEGILQ